MYVLPVAEWILRSGTEATGVSEAMDGLAVRDRSRVIEALVRLVEIGAMEELPRLGQRNAPRMFQRVGQSPYWDLVSAEAGIPLAQRGRESEVVGGK